MHQFANGFYHVAALASLVSKACGSLVVLKRSLSINIPEIFGCSEVNFTNQNYYYGMQVSIVVCLSPKLKLPRIFSLPK